MFHSSRLTFSLIFVLLLTVNGCYCFPSVRYRNPHDPSYEAACSCGRGDCPECQHRVERKKSVPWPLFHPVPTSPVFDSRVPVAPMPSFPSPIGELLPPLNEYHATDQVEAIDAPPNPDAITQPGADNSI